MNILQVVHGFPPGNTAGTEVYTYNLSKTLSVRHEVSVFYRTADSSRKEYELSCRESEGLKLFSINNTFRDYGSFKSTYRDERVAAVFGRVLEEVEPDIVHIQHLLYLSAGIVEEAKKRNIPVAFTLNDYWLLCPQGQLFRNNEAVCDGEVGIGCMDCVLYQLGIQKNVPGAYALIKRTSPEWFFQMIKTLYLVYAKWAYLTDAKVKDFLRGRIDFMRKLCAEVDLFIAPSEFMRKKFFEFGIPEEKIKLLPYGFDLPKVKAVPKTGSAKLRFGFIGNLMPAKGAHVLIKSFNALKTDKAELKIYGAAFSYKSALGNYVGHLKKMARSDRIKFMGAFDHQKIVEIFAEIDVLVVPSIWYENAPLVIQEALLARTPVIASRTGGVPELIQDGCNGLLFERDSHQDLTRKMEFFIEHPLLLKEFKTDVSKITPISLHAEKLNAFYERLIAGRSCETRE